MEEIKRDAELIVEIAEGSGMSFAMEIADGICDAVRAGKYTNEELVELISQVAGRIRSLNAWRASQGLKRV